MAKRAMPHRKQQAFLRMLKLRYYDVSSEGEVVSLRDRVGNPRKVPKVRKPSFHKRGYPKLDLYCKGKLYYFTVHTLVWIKFHGLIPDGFELNHIDADPKNCRLSNLEMVTRSQNAKHAFALGRRKPPLQFLNEENVREIRTTFGTVPAPLLAKKFKTDVSNIYLIAKRRTWKQVV